MKFPQEVLLTEEMALNLASNYAAIFTDKELVPCNPTKLYETDGQAIGYIIELYYRGAPYGYLVFDNNVEGLLAEISCAITLTLKLIKRNIDRIIPKNRRIFFIYSSSPFLFYWRHLIDKLIVTYFFLIALN